jgi:hypothetical protein
MCSNTAAHPRAYNRLYRPRRSLDETRLNVVRRAAHQTILRLDACLTEFDNHDNLLGSLVRRSSHAIRGGVRDRALG